VGIRAQDIVCEANALHCKVVSVTENPFSYLILLKPAAAEKCTFPICWETDKETWQSIAADEIDISIDPQKIILLKG